MQCTECKKECNQLHGERWMQTVGYVINKGEELCDQCAAKRLGFKLSGDLLKQRELAFGLYLPATQTENNQ